MAAYTFDLSKAEPGGIPIQLGQESLPKEFGFAFSGRSDNGNDDYECYTLRADEIDAPNLVTKEAEDGLILLTGIVTIEDKDRSDSEEFFSGCSYSGEIQISACLTTIEGQYICPWSDHYTLPCKEEPRVNGWGLESHNPPSEKLNDSITFGLILSSKLGRADVGDRKSSFERLTLGQWVDYFWGDYHSEDITQTTGLDSPSAYLSSDSLDAAKSFSESLSKLGLTAIFFADEESKRFIHLPTDPEKLSFVLSSQYRSSMRAMVLEIDNGDGWD